MNGFPVAMVQGRGQSLEIYLTIGEVNMIEEPGGIKQQLIGCNFEMAKTILVKQFAGGVLPKELVKLLQAFSDNPGPATGMDLILYDSKMWAVFELAKSGGFTEGLFRQGDFK